MKTTTETGAHRTTPTPRTDAALKSRNHLPEGWPDVVSADLARQLERELEAANALLREAHAAIVQLIGWPEVNKKQVKACVTALDRIAAHLEASK